MTLFKKKVGDNVVISSTLPTMDEYGKVKVYPITNLERKLMKKGNKAATVGLVQWSNLSDEDAIWEDL